MNQANPETARRTGITPWRCTPLLIVLLLGLSLRLYYYFSMPLINSDGFLYIQQAKALYYGLHDQLNHCISYLSAYPFFIATGYLISGDWLAAAQGVSLFFGTLTFFPLYGLLRRFFDETVSIVTLLVFAVLPAFVFLSQDTIRGPVYWFFTMTGLYLMICHTDRPRLLLPFLTALCFMIGAWARIEGILFIVTAGLHLVFARDEKRWYSLLSFLLPFLILSGIYLIMTETSIFPLLRMERLTRPLEVYEKYSELRQNLKLLADRNLPEFSPYFFDKVRNLVWWIALATLAVQIVETLYHVFFIVLAIGVVAYRRRIFSDRRILYLTGTAVLALVVLYAQILYNWSMTSRFVPLFLFPAYVFMGAGIAWLIRFLKDRFALRHAVATGLICFGILLPTLPKILRANYAEDKVIFQEIGQYIAQKEENRRAVSIAGAFKRVRTVHFYANLDYAGAPCFHEDCFFYGTADHRLQTVRDAGCDYLVWDEKSWQGKELKEFSSPAGMQLMPLKSWQSDRLGRLVLYQVQQ